MRYVMLVDNNDGGCPASLHDSFEAAKAATRAYLTDPEGEPPITSEKIAELYGLGVIPSGRLRCRAETGEKK